MTRNSRRGVCVVVMLVVCIREISVRRLPVQRGFVSRELIVSKLLRAYRLT